MTKHTFNLFEIDTMSKIETTSKVSVELTNKINLGRRGSSAELIILDMAYMHFDGLELTILGQFSILCMKGLRREITESHVIGTKNLT